MMILLASLPLPLPAPLPSPMGSHAPALACAPSAPKTPKEASNADRLVGKSSCPYYGGRTDPGTDASQPLRTLLPLDSVWDLWELGSLVSHV